MRNKYILFVVHRFHTNLVPVVESLVQEGHKVNVVGKYIGPNENHNLVRPIIIDPNELTANETEKIINELMPDFILNRQLSNNFALFSKIAVRKGIKNIAYHQTPCYYQFSFHALYKDIKRIIGRVYRKHPMKTLTPVLGHSQGVKKLFTKFIRFPMPVDENSVKQKKYFQNGEVTILCIGKLMQERKNHLWIIDALESIRINCRVIFAGAGPSEGYKPNKERTRYYKKLMDRVNNSFKKDKIIVYENYPFEKMKELYLKSDIFVLPSSEEPFSISTLEAMSFGCAVVTSNKNGASGYITSWKDGVLFEESNYEDFFNKFKRLISSKSLIEQLGQNALNTVRSKHNYSVFVQELLKALK